MGTKQKKHLYPSSRQNIPAGYGGYVMTPNKNDVLSGRGGRVNGHAGNKRYRDIANSTKAEYLSPETRKMHKAHIAGNIVWNIRQCIPPGRFLKADPSTGMWYEIGDKAAIRKCGQTLREKSSEFRACRRDVFAEDNRNPNEAESKRGSEL